MARKKIKVQKLSKKEVSTLIDKYLPLERKGGKGITKESLLGRLRTVGIYEGGEITPNLVGVNLESFLPEILAEIFSQVRDVRTLRSLLLACRSFSQISQTYPSIWKSQISNLLSISLEEIEKSLPPNPDYRKIYWGLLKIPAFGPDAPPYEISRSFLLKPWESFDLLNVIDYPDTDYIAWMAKYTHIELFLRFCRLCREQIEDSGYAHDWYLVHRELFSRPREDFVRIFDAVIVPGKEDEDDSGTVIIEANSIFLARLLDESIFQGREAFEFSWELISEYFPKESYNTIRSRYFRSGVIYPTLRSYEYLLEDTDEYDHTLLAWDICSSLSWVSQEEFYKSYRFLHEKGISLRTINYHNFLRCASLPLLEFISETREDYPEIEETFVRSINYFIKAGRTEEALFITKKLKEIPLELLKNFLNAPGRIWADLAISLIPRLPIVRIHRGILKPLLEQNATECLEKIRREYPQVFTPKSKSSRKTLWKNVQEWGGRLGTDKLRELFPEVAE